MSASLFLNDLGIVNPLGFGKSEVAERLLQGSQSGMRIRDDLIPDRSVYVGSVVGELPEISRDHVPHDSRNNRLFLAALMEIEDSIEAAKERYGRDRIAVILGTSTSSLCDGERGIGEKVRSGRFPDGYDYARQDAASISEFTARYLGLNGLRMTVSTACTSSAKTLASARRFINAGVCDAAIVGGADTICGFTLNGFDALESVSPGICNPFSRNRDGINIGEGAAVFLVTREEGPVEIKGIGETSDAHHISAPDPEGTGALLAMKAALSQAGIESNQVGYLNLHGTATPLNDAMEAKAVADVFQHPVLCSSTKPMTGHMLGATGANELGFLWLALQESYGKGLLPPHLWDHQPDQNLPGLNFVGIGEKADTSSPYMMSNSFAFGGNNLSVLLGKGGHG